MTIAGELVLGRETSTEITLERPKSGPPLLLTSIGRISAPRVVAPGRLQATFTLPAEKYPQVAIVAAVTEQHELIDWIAVPLHGQAQIDTVTEPGASVHVQLGDTRFGPVRPTRSGKARLNVIVPPGIRLGVTVAKDNAGNTITTPLELGTPAFNRLMGICPTRGDRLIVLVVDSRGTPMVNAPLKLSASAGRLAAPEMSAPGTYHVPFTISGQVRPGEKVQLGATLGGDESMAVCQVEIQGGVLNTLKISLDPPAYRAGSGQPVSVGIRFLDANGRPAQPVPLTLDAELGQLSELHASPAGQGYIADWTLPQKFGGRHNATIEVSSAGAPVIRSRQVLALESGPIARLELNVDHPRLVADGQQTTVITVRAFDAFDNPVRDASLTAEATGTVGEFVSNTRRGEFRATYRVPKQHRLPEDRVVVEVPAGGPRAETKIALLHRGSLIGMGPRVGYVTNFGKVSSFLLMVDATYRPDVWERNLSFGIEGGVYWDDREQQSADDSEVVSTSIRGVPLLARVAYRFPWSPIAVYFGLGGGVVVAHTEVQSASAGKAETGKGLGAVCGAAGADLALGPGRFVAELEYLYTFGSDLAVKGNLGGLLISAGYRFELSLK